MKKHTNVASLQELFPSYKVSSDKEFNKIPHNVVDATVNKNTDFSAWEEFKNAAVKDYVKRSLFKNV